MNAWSGWATADAATLELHTADNASSHRAPRPTTDPLAQRISAIVGGAASAFGPRDKRSLVWPKDTESAAAIIDIRGLLPII
jgi:hypothetical protein